MNQRSEKDLSGLSKRDVDASEMLKSPMFWIIFLWASFCQPAHCYNSTLIAVAFWRASHNGLIVSCLTVEDVSRLEHCLTSTA